MMSKMLLILAIYCVSAADRPNARRCLRYGRITLTNGQTVDGYKNVKGCDCEAARSQEWDQPHFADNYAPVCIKGGKWGSVQTDDVKQWCVDTHGNQISPAVLKTDRSSLKPCHQYRS